MLICEDLDSCRVIITAQAHRQVTAPAGHHVNQKQRGVKQYPRLQANAGMLVTIPSEL